MPAEQIADNVALVMEDDRPTAEAIAKVVRSLGYDTRIATTVSDARAIMNEVVPELVLADLGMPDGDGVDVLRELKAAGTRDVVVISGTPDQGPVVETLRIGVVDFLVKPVKLSQIHGVLTEIARRRQDEAIGIATPTMPALIEPARLVGESTASRNLREQVKRAAAQRPIRALVVGAPGVGKRNIAASIHHESGATGRALSVNCAQEVDGLTSLRFFGRVATDDAPAVEGYIELAADGTLVLDDLSQLPLSIQSSLKAWIDSGRICPVGAFERRRVDCAVVGILREPANEVVAAGRLSEDLYYALAESVIHVPPLSERNEDVLELAERAIAEMNRLTGTDKALSAELRRRLQEYGWPGNVLELRNTLRSAYDGTAPDEEIMVDRVYSPSLANNRAEPAAHLVGNSFREVEKKLLLATLEYTGGNKRQAARILGISLKTLYNRLHTYR